MLPKIFRSVGKEKSLRVHGERFYVVQSLARDQET